MVSLHPARGSDPPNDARSDWRLIPSQWIELEYYHHGGIMQLASLVPVHVVPREE